MSNYYGCGLVIESNGRDFMVIDTANGHIIETFHSENEADSFITNVMEAA